jgi:uridine phosphorylase
MDHPILEYDPSPHAVIDPAAVHPHLPGAPDRAVACYFPEVVERVCAGARRWVEREEESGPVVLYEIERCGRRLAVFHPGVGAPLAAARLEMAIASGVRHVMVCGGAGALVPELALGHVIVPSHAVRDEGTSYHYLPAAREIVADADVVSAAERTLRAREVPYVVGKTWTTDAVFRETPARVARRRAEGCITVEMEAAALMAVARFRGARLGYLLYAADSLAGEAWDSRGWRAHDAREDLFWLAADICLDL